MEAGRASEEKRSSVMVVGGGIAGITAMTGKTPLPVDSCAKGLRAP